MSLEKQNKINLGSQNLEKETLMNNLFDTLGVKKEDLFIDTKMADKFFELYGFNGVKKEDNKIFLSCYHRDRNSGRYDLERNLRVVLYGGGHTHVSNADDIVEMMNDRISNGSRIGTKEETLRQEIELSKTNFEATFLLIMAFGFRNLIKKSEFLKNEDNQIEVFIPWEDQERSEMNGSINFLQRTVIQNNPRVIIRVNKDDLKNEIFKEKQ